MCSKDEGGSKDQVKEDKLDRPPQAKYQQLSSSEPTDDGKVRRESSEYSEDNGSNNAGQCKSLPRRPNGRPVMLCRLPLHLISRGGGTPNNLQGLQIASEVTEVRPRNSNIGREGSGSPMKG